MWRRRSSFYQLPLGDVLVVCDDFNLPLGKLRFRSQGSAGGQNGLDDIIAGWVRRNSARLRIGIGPVPDDWDAADFVLSRFGPSERTIDRRSDRAGGRRVECWVDEGIEVGMNRFN